MATKCAPPGSVAVGAHVWRVLADADASARCVEAGDRGHALPDRQVIELDGNRPASGIAETLLHEVLHAALDDAGANAVPKLGCELLELVVSLLSPRLLATLRDNPALVDYLIRAR